MFKFLHAADLHLDSPLLGLAEYEGAPIEAIRGATRKALTHLVNLALAEQVRFVVIAGDIYDGDWRDHNTGMFFASEMSRLRQANTPVFLISGNHDAASRMSRRIPLPDNVLTLPDDAPASVDVPGCEAVVHGQGFRTPSITENLAAAYPLRHADRFNVGLLHTSLDGREGHASYAPCNLGDLDARGYEYWALGHVHQRELHEREGSVIAFSGNPQGRHIRETGEKGCLLVTVDDHHRARAEFRTLDVVRWETCRLDAEQIRNEDDAALALDRELTRLLVSAERRILAVRVELVGPSPAHPAMTAAAEHWTAHLRAVATDRGGGQVWIERVVQKTRPPSDQQSVPLAGPLAEVERLLAEFATSSELKQTFADELADLQKQLLAVLPDDPDVQNMCSQAELAAGLERAKGILWPALMGQETAHAD